jgi:multiple sugar transport system substrate-binding protein
LLKVIPTAIHNIAWHPHKGVGPPQINEEENMKVKRWRLSTAFAVLALIVSACSGSAASPTGPVAITWFVGLGTGTDAETQVPVQQAIVDEWNAAHPEIQVTLEVVPNPSAKDTLLTENAAGNPPDVVGPAGVAGSNGFYGNWLDLTDLIAESNYDLSQFPEAAVKSFNVGGQGQLGLPFATFPSMMYFVPSLFEEAGLNLPPTAYDEKYTMPDGSKVDWSWDTVREIGMLLTVDSAGKNATEAGFNPNNIVQYGYGQPWNGAPEWGSWFKAGQFLGSDGKTLSVPDGWVDAWTWTHDGIFKDHFIPSGDVIAQKEWGEGNAFPTGKIAMGMSYLWYTCCLGDVVKTDWNIAPAPSYKGTVSPDMNADTFRISKGSKHPKEAFTFMTYLLGEASARLLDIYGGMPAREADQAAFFATKDAQFTQGVHWDIAKESYNRVSSPSAEAFIPNYLKARDYIYADFTAALQKDAMMDVASYVSGTFLPALQAIADEKP